MEVPHIETGWAGVGKRERSSLNLMPSPRVISKVSEASHRISVTHSTPGISQLDTEIWLEVLHHPVPGQPGAGEAAGAHQVPHSVQGQDCVKKIKLSG